MKKIIKSEEKIIGVFYFYDMSGKKILLAFSFIVVWGFTRLLATEPNWTEQYYSNGIYKIISTLSRLAFGWIPFSVGDVFYTIGGFLILRWLLRNWRRSYKDFKNWVLELLTGFSFVYLAFHFFWAFNYYRQPLHQQLSIGKDYTTQQLISVTEQFIESANAAHKSVQYSDTLKVEVPYTKTEILNKTAAGYKVLSESLPMFKYKQPSIKASLYSIPLTYMGFSGYLNPFTNEAQVDILIPKYQLPSTASHEVAHQLGYAAENEANFIGVLACLHHTDPYFNYSGQVFALRYCLNELYLRDQETFKDLRKKIHPGILKNYRESQDFWNAYENPLEPLFKTTYDSYLKANNQDKGIESYSYVVALIVNYYQSSRG
jgi:hypothetical protein